MDHPFNLKGKKILITGASSGIGRSIAIECNKQGAIVYITGRNRTSLDNTFSLLESAEGSSVFYGDLCVESDLNNFTESVPILDGIVHCAGISEPKPFKFFKFEDLKKTTDINLFAPIILTHKLINQKKINKGASIVYISSMVGNKCSYVGSSIYGASKAGINGFIKGLALELASKKVRVNSIMPGMIETDLISQSSITKSELLEDQKKYPLKRYGRPEEVAYATIYLLSDASSWVTGSELLIDGGYTLN